MEVSRPALGRQEDTTKSSCPPPVRHANVPIGKAKAEESESGRIGARFADASAIPLSTDEPMTSRETSSTHTQLGATNHD